VPISPAGHQAKIGGKSISDLQLFNDNGLEGFLDNDGHPWVTARSLARRLGYANETQITNKIISRHPEFFQEGRDWSVVKLTTEAGERQAVILSEHGALKVCRYARTPLADGVMQEVIDWFVSHRRGEITPPVDRLALAQIIIDELRQNQDEHREIFGRLDEHAAKIEDCEEKIKSVRNRKDSLPPAERRLMYQWFKTDGCVECKSKEGAMHADHIIPWSTGGSDRIDNRQPLCAKCNLRKRDNKDRRPEWMKNDAADIVRGRKKIVFRNGLSELTEPEKVNQLGLFENKLVRRA